MERNLSCCFTGYRPEKFGFEFSPDNQKYNEFTRKLYAYIIDLAEEGITVYYSGMARGFDIVAAEAVIDIKRLRSDLGVSLVACVPYIEQASAFPPDWKARYDAVLEECDRVVLLSDRYYRGCYQVRNKYMVDNTDCVLTYFDGSAGGTKNTVDYAKKKGRAIVNLYENFGEQMELI